ncbi:MAG: hypothetical protein DRI81_07205 [Chloroflexi bacterium]|nr:MAG: hypothetical protein DRI81_07205 [Chloroflexota bacterium]
MKKTTRTATYLLKMYPDEYSKLKAAALDAGKTVADFIRAGVDLLYQANKNCDHNEKGGKKC